MKISSKTKFVAALALIAAGVIFYPFGMSPAPRAWHQVSTTMSRQQVYTLLGQPDSVSGDQSAASWKHTAWFVGRKFDVTFRSDDDAMTSHRESAALWPVSLFLR
jgi:dienelactone hydrolase